MKKLVIKYFSDILIIIGVSIFAINEFKHCTDKIKTILGCRSYNYVTPEAVGIILVILGIDIIIRKYYIKKSRGKISSTTKQIDTSDYENLYKEAVEVVVNNGKASASLIQRKLRIGYACSAGLLDLLEERGVIGRSNGSKPREVLIKKEK